MPNPLLNIVHRIAPGLGGGKAWDGLRREIIGIAQDYWHDGNWQKPANALVPDAPSANVSASVFANRFARVVEAEAQPIPAGDTWTAKPGEISEKLWGRGFVMPGDEIFSDLLLLPLGVSKDMNILDLSAGLGGRLRKAAEKFDVYITGREPDAEIAARGMAYSVAAGMGKHAAITAYDPMTLSEQRKYDCVVARETIYRAPDKSEFIRRVVDCCKPKAQISFTDYIVNPEMHDQPAITMWRAYEKGANPVGLVEMAELWAKAGVSIRVHDDQTDAYRKEVKAGLVRFVKFMASGVKPDLATKRAIEKRVTTWALRMGAIEQGMKFYRFYGIR